ncbi:hypothetical protein AMJ57_04750 [Parcubacteria bacterium SG8_24]|nr:MAG: hypothetical protein AMJ57_04750 [Parcubacteria bacterium SG8_24]
MRPDRTSQSFAGRVYEVVRRIPRGSVMTYRQVAEAVGSPRAARAVGSALRKNRDPRVPCHRVVRADGPGGYNRGPEVKLELLRREGAIAPDGRGARRRPGGTGRS